jgi:imidazolonepropionase-like amidohydrolase
MLQSAGLFIFVHRGKTMKKLLGLLCLLFAAPSFAQVTAIKAGNLIDPAKGTVLKDQVILIEQGKIKSVGAGLVIPAGAQVVDLSGEWVTAGLMDAHVHMALTEFEGNAPFESFYLNQSSTFRGLRGLHNAQAVMAQGFTTLRDVGNSGEYAMTDVRRAIDQGLFSGPTIIDAGKIIAPFGGQSRDMPPRLGSFWGFEYIDADGPAEVRKAVRTNIYYGAGVIKLVGDNNPYHYSLEEFRAAVDEAHHAGLPVSVHVYSGDAADNAIEAGVDSIEHGFELTDAQLKKMKDKGIFLVSTDFPRAHLDIVGTSGGILPGARRAGAQDRRPADAGTQGGREAGVWQRRGGGHERPHARRHDVRLPRRVASGRYSAAGHPARHDHRCGSAAANREGARPHRRRPGRRHHRHAVESSG